MNAPRGPAGPAARQYLLAGLICCGTCGPRLESSWVECPPAYRCRHGYTSATQLDPARAKNTSIREDQILSHLATLAILLGGQEHTRTHNDHHPGQVTGPAALRN